MKKNRLYISSEHLSKFDTWEECLRHGRELGFGGIEIFGNDIINGNLSQRSQQKQLKNLSVQYDMALSFHPWLEWAKLPFKEQVENMRLLLNRVLACGSNQLNLHLDFLTTHSSGAEPLIQLFTTLNPYIQQNGILIYFENVPKNHAESFGTKPEDFMAVFDALGNANYYFNLDTGHARLTTGIRAFLLQLSPYWKYSHIHDNDGISDQHKAPGAGSINWNEFFHFAKNVNYQGIFLYEFHEDGTENSYELLKNGYRIIKGGKANAVG